MKLSSGKADLKPNQGGAYDLNFIEFSNFLKILYSSIPIINCPMCACCLVVRIQFMVVKT